MTQATASTKPIAGRSVRAWTLFLTIVVLMLAVDLYSKSWSFAHLAAQPVVLTVDNVDQPGTLPGHEPRVVVPSILNLQQMINTGAVFGIGKGQRTMFLLVSIVAIGVIGWVFWHSSARQRGMHVALALILAGALGNLYDRARYGAVRDMLHLFPGVKLPFGWHWPGTQGSDELYPWIFNIADVALVIGVALMLLMLWRQPPRPDGDKAPH